ncbi:MAG: ammonia-forming cytochrome c nitrite reductase subunit c552 [Planctomycetes bacterium]|nr:ammonia-forming cytochrome c nitrite reductase subunit c552 [Planctomycetota bacterium]
MNALRLSLIALLSIGTAVGIYYIVAGASPPPAASAPPERIWRNEDCRACHPDVWQEWWESWHRMAWVDPLFKKLSNNYADRTCYDCHIPRNIPEVGFGPRTLPRASDKESGIHCLSCHYDGRSVVALRANPSAPCRPRAAPELGTELACIGCHNQHKLHEEWRNSVYFQQGVGCTDCHMPVVERRREDRTVAGRHHAFLSSRNRDFSRLAVAVSVVGPKEPGGRTDRLTVSITNQEVGHDFPSDSRHKAVDLMTQFLGADEQPLGPAHRERFHIPRRDALDQTRTTLPHGETRTFEYPLPAGAAAAEVQLVYRIMKDDPNVDAQTLLRRIVRW